MSRSPIGSYGWCEAGSTLDWRDKLATIAGLARVQVREMIERSGLARRSLQRMHVRCDLDAIRVPDTKVASAATEYAATLYTPSLYRHCVRTWMFGRLMAQGHGIAVDEELLYVGAILHDVGISEGYIGQACELCFATVGARAAQQFVAERGWDPQRSRQLYEAVSLHFNPFIDHEVHGAAARFVGEGAHLDVLGTGFQRVPPRLLQQVLVQNPRVGLAEEIKAANRKAQHPKDSRPGFLGEGGFNFLLERNPLVALERAARPG